MSTLIVVGFKKDLYRASEVLNELVEMDYAWTIDLNDAVAAYRDYNGKLRIDASYQMTTGEGAELGGFFGSLIGLTLGAIDAPDSAGGSLDAKWWKDDFGIPDDFVKDVGALAQPGDSAIFALLRTADPTLVAPKFNDYGGVMLSTALSPEQANKVQDVLNGKNNFNFAGISPQIKKENHMATWTEMEKQIEPQLRAFAQSLDEMDAQEAAAEAEFNAKINAAAAEMAADIQAESDKMRADYEARRAKVQRDMNALNDQINAAADRLDAETAKAVGQAKADLEAQRAKMRADREKLNAQLKASYEAQVKFIKNQIEQMRTRAQTTAEKNRAKINAQLDATRKQLAEVEQQIKNLHAEHVATWNENKAKVERAMADLKEGREKAVADLKEGHEKAKSEFKTAT